MLGRDKKDHVPLYQSYMEDIPSSSNPEDTKKSKKKKKVRMDPQTQKSLTTIHKHLMVNGKIKNGFMTSSSQLVNDKQTKKDRAENPTSSLSSSSTVRKLQIDPMPTKDAKSEEKDVDTTQTTSFRSNKSTLSKSALLKLTQGSDAILESDDNGNYDKDSKPASWLNSYKKKKSIYLSAYNNSHPNNVGLKDSMSSSSNSSEKSFSSCIHSTNICSSGSSSSSFRGSHGSSKSKKKSLPWLEALKKKQKSLRPKQMTASNLSTHVEEIEGTDELMRQISPKKKQKTTPPSSPNEVAPWGRVQLRSTPKRESFFGTPSEVNDGNEDARDIPPKSQETSSLPALFSVGDIINLDALPRNIFPTQEESAVFPLNDSKLKQGEDTKNIVVVGKNAIITASYITGNHSRKASVTWSCHRSEVQALTLNVEATGANLALTHGRPPVPLMFHSADACLDFAQAFYRGPSTKSEERMSSSSSSTKPGDSAPKKSLVAISVPKDVGEGGADTSTNLTEDEESLLNRYRKFSESDRLKIRLTCLSPKGQVEEVEVSLSPMSNSAKASVADKYRKMLKMGITTSAVMHKMVTEGVDPDVISAVLDAPASISSGGKDGTVSSLSGEEEIAASKYRKMLKMGIPPDAVRHKMTSDGLPSHFVDAVLNDSKLNESSNKPSREEEAIASKYRKMLKMGVPPDAVRHKMMSEEVDTKIIDVVLSEPMLKEDSNGLSEEEESITSKYRKMLKMGVPPDAVRYKMTSEGVDAEIINAVLNVPKPNEDLNGLSEEEEIIASKYRKMLKMRVPPDAVRHKMTSEGVDTKIIDAVFASSQEISANVNELSDEEEVIASKYRKMLKMAVPLEAVKHKMTQDSIDLKIVSAVIGETKPLDTKHDPTPAITKNAQSLHPQGCGAS